jgi:hypothetical protein
MHKINIAFNILDLADFNLAGSPSMIITHLAIFN